MQQPRTAQHAPESIANSEAACGLEQVLIEAMVDCLAASDRHADSAARPSREWPAVNNVPQGRKIFTARAHNFP